MCGEAINLKVKQPTRTRQQELLVMPIESMFTVILKYLYVATALP